MLGAANPVQVYLATGPTDMRKAMNGLALIVEAELNLNPLDGSLFVFCNRRRNILKVLYYDHNGFCLFMKRLESATFRWPMAPETPLQISKRELGWLLDGLELRQPNAHRENRYKTLY